MELQTRHYRRRIPTWRRIALSGLGDGTCQYPQPGVPQVYPPCTAVNTGGSPATYVAPNLTPVPGCISGPEPYSAECQALLMATQHQNQSALDAANRAVFVANCNRDYQANATRYRELGMEVPPNDCEYRAYGQTLPGTTGGTAAYLPGTPQGILDWRAANPAGGSPGPAAGSTSPGGLALSFAFTNLTSGDNTNFKVGDRWQIDITGPPNAPVSMNGGRNGENNLHQMGVIDSSGRFKLNGQMGQGEIGSWTEAWRVNNQIIASFSFRVQPSGSVTGNAPATTGGGQTAKTSSGVLDKLPGGLITIGGSDIPIWALGAAAVVAYFMFKRGR